jgi:hypothetical protein
MVERTEGTGHIEERSLDGPGTEIENNYVILISLSHHG